MCNIHLSGEKRRHDGHGAKTDEVYEGQTDEHQLLSSVELAESARLGQQVRPEETHADAARRLRHALDLGFVQKRWYRLTSHVPHTIRPIKYVFVGEAGKNRVASSEWK